MNKYISKKIIMACYFPIFLWNSVSVARATENNNSLSMHGSIYPNSCNINQQNRLKKDLFSNVMSDPAQAWNLIKLFLCSPSDDAHLASAFEFTSKKLYTQQDETGSDSHSSSVVRSKNLVKQLMANGNAWSADIQVNDSSIKLQYFRNEACVNGLTFAYVKPKWVLKEFSEACD